MREGEKIKSQLDDIDCLGTFLTVRYIKLNGLPFFQTLKPLALDGTIVDENIPAVFSFNKSIAFGVVEPLHLPCRHCCFLLGLQMRKNKNFSYAAREIK